MKATGVIKKKQGPNLEVDVPSPKERDWIFERLAAPEIHIPLACPRAPTRELFDAGKIEVAEEGEIELESVRFWIARQRAKSVAAGETRTPRSDPSGAGGHQEGSACPAVAFYVEYGWEGYRDTTREFDLAIPGSSGSLGLYLEAHILGIMFVFDNALAKRMRWSVAVTGERPFLWYERIGARTLGRVHVQHPLSGEPIFKQVYEVSRLDFQRVLAQAGMSMEQDYSEWEKPLWQVLGPRSTKP